MATVGLRSACACSAWLMVAAHLATLWMAQLVGKTRIDRTVSHTADEILLKTMKYGVRYRGPMQRVFKYFAGLQKSARASPKKGGPQLGACDWNSALWAWCTATPSR